MDARPDVKGTGPGQKKILRDGTGISGTAAQAKNGTKSDPAIF